MVLLALRLIDLAIFGSLGGLWIGGAIFIVLLYRWLLSFEGNDGPTEHPLAVPVQTRSAAEPAPREHDGVMPEKIELVKVSYAIPSPEQTAKNGYYIAEELLARSGKERVSYTARCEREVQGQLPNFIRERDGLPLLDEGEYKAWHKHKQAAWERRKEKIERAKAEAKQAEQQD